MLSVCFFHYDVFIWLGLNETVIHNYLSWAKEFAGIYCSYLSKNDWNPKKVVSESLCTSEELLPEKITVAHCQIIWQGM